MSIFNRGTSIIVQEGSDLSVQLAIDAELGAREAEAAAAASAVEAAGAAATAADEAATDAVAAAAALIAADVSASEAARDAAAASATAADADATATAADRVQTGLDRVATGADVVAAAASATAADGSATTASSAAVAASEAIGANVYNTKAEADAALAGLADGARAMVLVDESLQGARTLYVVTAGAFVFLRYLGDQSLSTITERYGFGQHMRYTMAAMAKLDRDAWGSNGPGNANDFPLALTASQSGTTVTASAAVMWRYHSGSVIRWASGEWARIVSVDSQNITTTVTVDRSQTVASGPAVIDVKPVVMVYQGDSLGFRLEAPMKRWGWRAMGYGGEIIMAANQDNTVMMSARVDLAGGATQATPTDEWDEFPYSQYWSVPAGGSVTASPQNTFIGGTEREFAHGLSIEEMLTDTATIVWRRGAGSITIQRKRFSEPTWVDVETIADTSTGTTAFNYVQYTHDLGYDWQYRILGVSGTVKVLCVAYLNLTNPGFVPWRISRGSVGDSRDLEQFVDLPAADLAELCQIFMPDARFTLTADEATSVADGLSWLNSSSDLWETAWPYMDHVFLELWEDGGVNTERGVFYNTAVLQHCLARDYSFVPLYDLFGDFDTQSKPTGYLEDAVHPGKLGRAVMLHQVLRVTGLDAFPVIAEGRNVNARKVDARFLSINGKDVKDQIDAATAKPSALNRGADWDYGTSGVPVASGLSAALGNGDFTISIELKVMATSPARLVTSIGTDGYVTSQNGGLALGQIGSALIVYLRDASGNTIEYRYGAFGTSFADQIGVMTVRSDVANGKFDILWNGSPIPALTATIAGNTTSPLGTWAGTGTQFGIPNGINADRSDAVYGAMLWLSRVSDADLQTTILNGRPAITPELWWDFSEGIGRRLLDKSGNGRDGQWRGGNANFYSVGAGPTWAFPKRGELGVPWLADLSQGTVLLPGDNVVAAYPANRDMLLPATASVGDVIRVTVNSTFLIRVTQNAGQQIKSGASATTVGTGGSLTIPNASSVTLRCVTGGASSVWVVEASSGAALTFT